MTEANQEQRVHRLQTLESALHQAEHVEKIAKMTNKVLNLLAKDAFSDNEVREVLDQINGYFREEQ